MNMRLPYVTLRDPSLDHQVIFLSNGGVTFVSCNCLTDYNPRNGVESHASIGESHDLVTARSLYNNPSAHRKPFTDKDIAKW